MEIPFSQALSWEGGYLFLAAVASSPYFPHGRCGREKPREPRAYTLIKEGIIPQERSTTQHKTTQSSTTRHILGEAIAQRKISLYLCNAIHERGRSPAQVGIRATSHTTEDSTPNLHCILCRRGRGQKALKTMPAYPYQRRIL